MDIKLRYKEGKAMAVTEAGEARIIKLVLKDEFLEIMEKVNPCKLDSITKIQQIATNKKLATESSFSYSKLPVERTVEIMIDENNPSLGISVKGGSDFNLPILISRIIPGERADKTDLLFVGDAILELNGKSMMSCTHKEAVQALLSAGSHVTVHVRHLPHAATVLLNEGIFKRQLSMMDDKEQTPQKLPLCLANSTTHCTKETFPVNGTIEASNENIHQLPPEQYSYLISNTMARRKTKSDSKNWIIGLRVALQYAYLSVFEYQRSHHWEKLNSFMVKSIDGHSTGIISFRDPTQFHYWKEAIKFNINALLINNIKRYNESSVKENQVHYMGWLYFIGESNGAMTTTCKSYHESEYANIDTIAKQLSDEANRTAKIQCIPNKQKATDEAHPTKWCYLPLLSDHKTSASTPTKGRHPPHHSDKTQHYAVPRIQSQLLSRGHSIPLRPIVAIDRPLFVILRGIYILIFVRPPTVLGEWFTPLRQYFISRSMISQRKMGPTSSSTVPGAALNNHCGEDATSSGNVAMSESVQSQCSYSDCELSPTAFILKIELIEFECITDSLADLLELEKIWIHVNYYAVSQMRMDSFKCIYQNIDSILCLDFDYGLKLINAADGIKIWQYKYHQLRASSDDGENRLRLIFSDQNNGHTRIDQVLHCHCLGTVLISIQSFLTAKLGQVDPRYFDS